MTDHYILQGKQPVAVDLMTWAKGYEKADRRVAFTQVSRTVEVSTVFLGLNHNFGVGPPLLFESMTFGGPNDGDQDRYATWDEAVAGHEKMVAACKTKEAGK